MRFSQLFLPTLKEIPSEAQIPSHQLMLRAGMIRKLASGIYSWLPLGYKVLKKVENIVREEMDQADAQELLLPTLHPRELWDETGRWDLYGEEMLKVVDRNKRDFGLGPTHEEIITDLVRKEVRSYRQLPIILYQFQTKFRDEIRPRFGIMRCREFLMKDAYSFDKDEQGLEKSYRLMQETYKNIFSRCSFKFKMVEAESGPIGGSLSHEFMVLADTGEEAIYYCPSCNFAIKEKEEELLDKKSKKEDKICRECKHKMIFSRVIEVGHTFYLGTKYSQVMQAMYLNENGENKPIIMGCYGIGVSRIVAASIEQSHDENGIIWPMTLSPYQVVILPLDVSHKQIKATSDKLYDDLKQEGFEVLIDDRDERAGVKFKDADLIGIPIKVIVSSKSLDENKVEIKLRKDGRTYKIAIDEALNYLKKVLKDEF